MATRMAVIKEGESRESKLGKVQFRESKAIAETLLATDFLPPRFAPLADRI